MKHSFYATIWRQTNFIGMPVEPPTTAVPAVGDSDPFGNGVPNENPAGLGRFSFNLHFPGQYADSETGLNYNYFRDYNPKTGRYVQSDPIGLNGGANTYGYAFQNPLSNSDALGLEVLLQSHEVGGGLNHSKLTIIPENQARWKKDPRFYSQLPDGRHYATLGAGPEDGYLVSRVNRERDVQLWRNVYSSKCPVSKRYDSEDALIETLFDIDSKYGDKVDYAWLPSKYSDGYNSNSYVNGLLKASGIRMSAPPNTPGYSKALPLRMPK